MENELPQNFIEDNLLIMSKQTYELMVKRKDYLYVLGLYMFYYYTAKWQKTNQPRCTVEYTAKGAHMNEDTVRRYKKILMDLDLISDIKKVDKISGKVTGWYVRLNYLWRKETLEKNHPPSSPEGGFNQRVDFRGTNALSANSKMLKVKYKIPLEKETDFKKTIGIITKLPIINKDEEYVNYLADLILEVARDGHSIVFYHQIAQRFPEAYIRQCLQEIEKDGARNPGALFTSKIQKMALAKSMSMKTTSSTAGQAGISSAGFSDSS